MTALSAQQRCCFEALGSDLRQDVLVLLQERPHTHPELIQRLGRVTKLDYHLRCLQRSGLVSKTVMGPHEVLYTLNAQTFRDVAQVVLSFAQEEQHV